MISTEFIFLIAIVVFLLMVVGIILTMHEFERISEEPSLRKGAGSGMQADHGQEGHASHS